MSETGRRWWILLGGAILLIALALRATGLRWGLPDPTHYFSFHPDEWVLLGHTLGLDFPRGQFDPQFYNYGTLYLYLVHLALLAGFAYGWLVPPQDISQYQAVASLHLTGRWLSVVAGVLTCWLTWEMGKRLCGERCAVLAALLLAVVPLHTVHSHFLTTDATATLFTTGALLAAMRLYETGSRRALLGAAVLTALAAATRYNAGVVGVVPLLAWGTRARERREAWMGGVLLFLAVSAVAFLIFCPGMWLNPEVFWRDVRYEARHVREGHGLVFVNTGWGWVYHYWTNLRFGLGLPLLLLSTLAVVVAALSRRPLVLLLWVFVVGYYLFLGAFAVRFGRYLLPLLPPLMALTAWLVAEGWRQTRGAARALLAAVTAGVALYTVLWGTAVVTTLLQPDPRLQALQWIQREVPPGTAIGFATIPWFYTPPLSPYWGELQASRRAERAREVQEYRLLVPQQEWDPSVLRQAQVVVLSEFEVDDAVRIRHAPATAFLEEMQRSFQRVAQFDTTFRLGALDFGKRHVPHDMLYPFARVEIWRRTSR